MTPRVDTENQKSFVVGVTGPSGSGKSDVCKALAKEGFTIVNVDKIAKTLYFKGKSGYSKLTRAFGPDILDRRGNIDRGSLGQLVFSQPKARQKLNRMLFPLIYKAVQEKIVLKQRLGKRKICLDMAVLFDSGASKLCDRILLVDDLVSRRIARLIKRGLDPVRARSQAKALTFSQRERKRSVVLHNRGTRADLHRRARDFIRLAITD